MTHRPERLERLTSHEAHDVAESVGIPAYMADLNVFQVLLHHPRLARAINDLLSTLLWDGHLDSRWRELVIMRIGWLTRSDYEWTQHWSVATSLGISTDDLLGVRDWKRYPDFGPAERAVLAATDETVQSGGITDPTWAQCAEHVGTGRVLIELVAAIGTWQMIATILNSLHISLEDGVDSWPPDGVQPA